MRIAIISGQIFPQFIGGAEKFNYYFIKELASKGNEIWVISLYDYEWNNKNIHHIKLWGKFSNMTIPSLFFNLIKLKRKIDLIHITYGNNPYFAYLYFIIKKITKIPYIITIFSGGINEWKWKFKIPFQLFFKNADAIVGVSEIISKEFEKRSDKRIRVIPPLIPFTVSKIPKTKLKKKYGLNKYDVIILSLGSIKKTKGSNVLLDAFMSLEKQFIQENKLKLLYVGDGDMKKELEKKIDNMVFHKYVKFLGHIPEQNVPEMYKMADIYITATFFEGTSISVLEAMLNGLPIIASNVNGINNIFTHNKNALLFEKGNIQELKNKIIELVKDKKLIKKLSEAAKKVYEERYKFNEVKSAYLNLMYKILDDKK